jgi:hypothetical protein
MSGSRSHIEISVSELPPYAERFHKLADDACASRFFRASPKSCEFLRHVVNRSVEGNTDELKERLIGMTLFGREATYDTGSDATVRVRANDVRKRLAAYNDAKGLENALRFELPTGTYVPRFFRVPEPEVAAARDLTVVPVFRETAPGLIPLSLQHLAIPTLCALFLCVICLRWQVAQDHPFTAFWQGVFRDGNVALYVSPAEAGDTRGFVGLQKIEASSPLLNLAGQFHSQMTMVDTPQSTGGELLIIVDDPPHHATASSAADAVQTQTDGRLAIQDTTEGIRVVDRTHAVHTPFIEGRAALLTIEHSPQRRISIEGTDITAISSIVKMLCERNSFPDILAETDEMQGTTQIVFPEARDAQPIVIHEPEPGSNGRTEGAS